MAKINAGTFRNWNNGEVMNEADYEQEREIIRTAINDNYDRLIKKFEVLDSTGTLKTTQNLDLAINYLKFKESDTILLTLDNTTGTLTLAVKDASVSTAKLVNASVTTVKLADASVTTAKIVDGAVTLSKVDTVTLDTRYTTKAGDHPGTWQGYVNPIDATDKILLAEVEKAKRAPIEYTWTATANQTSFVLPNGDTFPVGEKAIEKVLVDGVEQTSSVVEKVNGTGFDLSEGVPSGAKVFIRYYKFHVPWTAGHSASHYTGGTDALDVTRLTNYQTEVADKIGILKKDRVSVLDYSAKGDGVTDDIVAINNAVDFLVSKGGGILYFPKGIYAISAPIPFRSNVILLGAGMGSTTIKGLSNDNLIGEATPTSAYSLCGIEDLTIDGNSANIAFPNDDALGNAMRLNQISYSRFKNVRIINSIFNAVSIYNNSHDNIFENFVLDGIGKTGTNPAVYTYCGFFIEAGSSRNKIINPRINNTKQYGVWFGARDADNYDNEVINPWIAQTAADGIRIGDDATANTCHRPKIINPTILAAGDIGIRAYHAGTGKVTDLEINGGVIQDCTNRGVLLDTATENPRVIGTKIKNCGTHGLTIAGSSSFIANVKVTGSTTKDIDDVGTSTQLIGTNIIDGRQGSFTPTIQKGGTNDCTYSSQQGSYRINGNRVEFNISIVLTGKGTATGNLTIGGLPFLSKSAGAFGSPQINVANVTYTGIPFGLVLNNDNKITLYTQSSGSTSTPMNDTNIVNTSEFYITGSYEI